MGIFVFFQINAENEEVIGDSLNNLCCDIDNWTTDYVLKNFETEEVIAVPNKFLGKVIIRFDNLGTIKNGTFEKIDKLKKLKTRCGYCRGDKPLLRPIKTLSIKYMDIAPEIIYLVSNSSGNLKKINGINF